MADLEYVATKLDALSERKTPYEMTGRRLRRLQDILMGLSEAIEFDLKYASLGRDDMESAGEIDFLLSSCFPDGIIPERFQKYAKLAGVAKYIGEGMYERVVTAKLQKDDDLLRAVRGKDQKARERAITESIERVFYAQGLVGVLEADELRPDKSRVQVLYENKVLYEENIPDNAFSGLPERITVFFDYTEQGLKLQLQRTLDSIPKKRSEAERAILDGMAHDQKSKAFISDMFAELESSLKQP